MKQTLLLLLFLSIHTLKAQNTCYILLDSLEEQTTIFKEKERILSSFKASFNEKDSLMVTEFEKKYKEYIDVLQMAEHTGKQNRLAKELESQQKKIMVFEESILKADSVLNLEMKAWVKDFIKTKVRFYEKSKNIKIVFLEKIDDNNTKTDFTEIINFINESNWKIAYNNQYNFLKNKLLFDFKLE